MASSLTTRLAYQVLQKEIGKLGLDAQEAEGKEQRFIGAARHTKKGPARDIRFSALDTSEGLLKEGAEPHWLRGRAGAKGNKPTGLG